MPKRLIFIEETHVNRIPSRCKRLIFDSWWKMFVGGMHGSGTPNNNKSVKILRHNEYAQRQVHWFFSTHSHTTTAVWKKKRIHKQIFWMSTWFASIILFLLFYHIILWLLAFHWIYFHACMRREQEEDWIKRNETNELTPE